MKKVILTLLIVFTCLDASSQSRIVKDFEAACDSLNTLMSERTGVNGRITLKAVMKRGSVLDFYFTESLSDYPWRKGDPQWFRSTLKNLFPDKYKSYALGEIYTKRISHEKLVTPELGFSGSPSESRHSIKNPDRRNIVTEIGVNSFGKGLSGRHIALWQSHGMYYDIDAERWQWQRPCLFQTVEDMFTQSFVLPFLVPMLENAGAYVLLPRERDIQKNEVIADNDGSHEAYGTASYEENGKWENAGSGFAALKAFYTGTENSMFRSESCGLVIGSITQTPAFHIEFPLIFLLHLLPSCLSPRQQLLGCYHCSHQ